jgi:antitoxin HigA-1
MPIRLILSSIIEEHDMTTYKAIRNPNRCPAHPGEAIADILDDVDTPKTQVALNLGISRQHLYELLAGRKPLSPTIAAKLGKMFGGGPGIWLNMQAAHDAWHAERDVDVSGIEPIRAA